MVSTRQAVDAVSRWLGFDHARVCAVGRSLTDAGVLPSGGPGVSPELNPDHVVSLVLTTAADKPLRASADTGASYRALRPGGIPADVSPSAFEDAGRTLDIFADIAVHGDSDILRRDRIEVVATWPEIAIHSGGTAKRFVPAGSEPNRWQAAGHRRSTTINGAALVDCLRELFVGKPDV